MQNTSTVFLAAFLHQSLGKELLPFSQNTKQGVISSLFEHNYNAQYEDPSLYIAVADLGGVRGVQMHPPFCPAL